jgi:hypothetical protein
MEVSLRGLGDAQADCDALKRLDPITPGVFLPCTPAEVATYIPWKAGADADLARHQAAEAVNPATAYAGAVNWLQPGKQIAFLSSGRAPVLYYVGAALPFLVLYFLFGGKK